MKVPVILYYYFIYSWRRNIKTDGLISDILSLRKYAAKEAFFGKIAEIFFLIGE